MTRTTLTEAATLQQGTTRGNMLIRLITPGVGSSGVYTAEVLEAAAKAKAFPAGTLMFADHPSQSDLEDRPERSIRDLAGVLIEDARWDPTDPALVAEVKTFTPWTQVLNEMKDDVGVSIRAIGEAEEFDDQGRPIVAELIQALSVDFVTRAGRGGRIMQILESARAAEAAPPSVPTDPAGQSNATDPPGETMATIQIEETEHRSLVEQAGRVTALEVERDQAITDRDQALAQVVEANRATDQATAARIITAAENYQFNDLETAGLLATVPLIEGRLDVVAFTATVTEAAATHAAQAGAGRVTGVGTTITTESWAAFDSEFITPKGV